MAAQVVVLGTAQDGGVPHAGCACPTCEAARDEPALRRRVASIAVVGETGRILLIDSTPDFPGQIADLAHRLGRPKPSVDAILLTHAHVGHYLGLAYLGREAMDVRRMPLWCTESMARFLGANRPWAHLVGRGCVDLRLVVPDQPFVFDHVDVWPFLSPHRAEDTDTLGVEVRGPSRRLVYLPDADRLSADLVARIRRAHVALVDGTFYDRAELGHRDVGDVPHPFVAESVATLAGAAGEIHFTHLNHTNRLLQPGAALPPGFQVLAEQTTFPLA